MWRGLSSPMPHTFPRAAGMALLPAMGERFALTPDRPGIGKPFSFARGQFGLLHVVHQLIEVLLGLLWVLGGGHQRCKRLNEGKKKPYSIAQFANDYASAFLGRATARG